MPTFDYACQACEHTFEFNRSFGSNEHPLCPECQSKDTLKLMHTPNIVFKGEGFYKTDSTTKPVKKIAPDVATTDVKTESKPTEPVAKTPEVKPVQPQSSK